MLAIWGIETRYGRVTGRTPVFQALATLAWEPRRADYFRGELFNALTMVDRRTSTRESMTGSWAGAMGQTQFMPSSYLEYAVDFDKDRPPRYLEVDTRTRSRRSPITSRATAGPTDLTWGREVRVSDAANDANRCRADEAPGRLLRDPQHDRTRPAGALARSSASPASTAARCRRPTSTPDWSMSASGSSWSTRTTTRSSATTARTTTRSLWPCSPIRSTRRQTPNSQSPKPKSQSAQATPTARRRAAALT